MALSVLECKFPRCLYTATASYTLFKHKPRRKYGNELPSLEPIPSANTLSNYQENETMTNVEKRIHTAPFAPQTPPPSPSRACSPLQTSTKARANYLIRALAASFTELERKFVAFAINELISILKDPAFSISEFDCAIRTTYEFRSLTTSLVDGQLSQNDFSPI